MNGKKGAADGRFGQGEFDVEDFLVSTEEEGKEASAPLQPEKEPEKDRAAKALDWLE